MSLPEGGHTRVVHRPSRQELLEGREHECALILRILIRRSPQSGRLNAKGCSEVGGRSPKGGAVAAGRRYSVLKAGHIFAGTGHPGSARPEMRAITPRNKQNGVTEGEANPRRDNAKLTDNA